MKYYKYKSNCALIFGYSVLTFLKRCDHITQRRLSQLSSVVETSQCWKWKSWSSCPITQQKLKQLNTNEEPMKNWNTYNISFYHQIRVNVFTWTALFFSNFSVFLPLTQYLLTLQYIYNSQFQSTFFTGFNLLFQSFLALIAWIVLMCRSTVCLASPVDKVVSCSDACSITCAGGLGFKAWRDLPDSGFHALEKVKWRAARK